jgi:hypothetical protein
VTDEMRGVIAVAWSFLASVGAGLFAFIRWRATRRDRSDAAIVAERSSLRDERALLFRDVKDDTERYRQLWLAEQERAIIWERRCRFMDERAHELRHQLNNDRQIGNGIADITGRPPPAWPDNPRLPKLEDL